MDDVRTKKLEEEVLNLRFKEVHDKLEEVCTTLDKILDQTDRINNTIEDIEVRTSKLEEIKRHCPVDKVNGEFAEFKKKAGFFLYLIDHPKTFWIGLVIVFGVIDFSNIKSIVEFIKSIL